MKEMNWILIRGLVRETRHWENFPGELEKRSSSVHLLEIPGVGSRIRENSPLQIKEYVEKMRIEFKKLELKGKVGIVGVSLGGMIAQSWLEQYPEDFDLGVIINSSAANLSPFYHRFKPAALKSVSGLLFNNDFKKREETILKLITNTTDITPDLVERWARIATDAPVSRFTMARQVRAASTFRAPGSLKKPVLILVAKNDRLADYRCSEALAENYQAPIHHHPEAGHDLTQDDPHWVIDRMDEFSQSV